MLPCDLSLIAIHISDWRHCSDTHSHKASAATWLRHGGICKYELVANLLPSPSVKKSLKIGSYLVKLWASVWCLAFLTHGVYCGVRLAVVDSCCFQYSWQTSLHAYGLIDFRGDVSVCDKMRCLYTKCSARARSWWIAVIYLLHGSKGEKIEYQQRTENNKTNRCEYPFQVLYAWRSTVLRETDVGVLCFVNAIFFSVHYLPLI